MEVYQAGTVVGKISNTTRQLHGTIRVPAVIGGDAYTGPYEVVPTQERQRLSTAGKSMIQDIVVEAIPKNYGLITYNGFEITVS